MLLAGILNIGERSTATTNDDDSASGDSNSDEGSVGDMETSAFFDNIPEVDEDNVVDDEEEMNYM